MSTSVALAGMVLLVLMLVGLVILIVASCVAAVGCSLSVVATGVAIFTIAVE